MMGDVANPLPTPGLACKGKHSDLSYPPDDLLVIFPSIRKMNKGCIQRKTGTDGEVDTTEKMLRQRQRERTGQANVF